tara:strand:+ start:75 stop:404 length:330 start_codon:yes stop_codon:yes gene_type:complete
VLNVDNRITFVVTKKEMEQLEFKGTSGEWEVSTQKGGYDIDITNRDGFICWLGLSEFNNETTLNNAKLIAAAPELLEALQMFLDYCYGTELQNSERFLNAEKAINKALK